MTTEPPPPTPLSPHTLLGRALNEAEQQNAPLEMFASGELRLVREGTRVAIVGARKASAAGLKRARKLAFELAREGVVIVSGLAEGIDTAAHEGAIASGGRTVAVIGTPLERVYPAKNRNLQERIMRDHLVVSPFAPGSRIFRGNFPYRNRVMALISDATVIVEASETSGSLVQGWEAIRLGPYCSF
jgi:DNA processing protein